MNPLVTINILSYNRKDELRNTLQKVYEQSYKNIEVIVVDNASTDGSSEMVKSEFPDVILIKLDENIGIAGWNKGFEIAKGEYVLVLDDDSYPSVDLLSAFITSDPNKETIYSLQIENLSNSFSEMDEKKFESLQNFIGCGVILDRAMVLSIGGFNQLLFIYHHEIDFTFRAIGSGFNIEYFPHGKIYHISAKFGEISSFTKYHLTRNPIIILLSFFSLRKVFFRIIRFSLGRVLSTFRYQHTSVVLAALWDAIYLSPKILINRKILPKEIQNKYYHGSFFGGFHFAERGWEF